MRRRTANAVTRRSHARIFVHARDKKRIARPRSATCGCQSVMLGAAEARHVATGCWSILPSRCDGRLRGQRLCVPGDGRGQNMTRNGEAGFGRRLPGKRSAAVAALAATSVLVSAAARADEGGVGLWLPGFF